MRVLNVDANNNNHHNSAFVTRHKSVGLSDRSLTKSARGTEAPVHTNKVSRLDRGPVERPNGRHAIGETATGDRAKGKKRTTARHEARCTPRPGTTRQWQSATPCRLHPHPNSSREFAVIVSVVPSSAFFPLFFIPKCPHLDRLRLFQAPPLIFPTPAAPDLLRRSLDFATSHPPGLFDRRTLVVVLILTGSLILRRLWSCPL